MTGEEQSILAALVAAKQNGGMIGSISGAILIVLGWLAARVWSGLQGRLAAAEQTAKDSDKNRRDDSNTIHKKLDEHIAADAASHSMLAEIMRQNTSKLGDIHADLQKALAERPTRAEVNGLIELHQGRKPA